MDEIKWDTSKLGTALAELADEDLGLPAAMIDHAFDLAEADGFEVVGRQMFRGYLAAAVSERVGYEVTPVR